MKVILILVIIINVSILGQSIEFIGNPEIFSPGIVSVKNSEVKITFSKNRKLVLWGSIGREGGVGGFDIWQATISDTGWSNPQPASFNSTYNDFDPSFSADGNILYFFSNRPGGEGGDDIYFVMYDSLNQSFGEPINIGNKINTKGDEWGPIESFDGQKLLFCTDGLGGRGEHDIFVCERLNDGWGNPNRIEGINFEDDDFDPVFLNDNKTIIFTRKFNEDEAYLFISYLTTEGYTNPVKLPSILNINKTWNFGSSVNLLYPSTLFFSSFNENDTQGRLDIYFIKYDLREID